MRGTADGCDRAVHRAGLRHAVQLEARRAVQAGGERQHLRQLRRRAAAARRRQPGAEQPGEQRQQPDRSEEHTSELQSLMRNSYAVFCLQKKTKTTTVNEYSD